MTPSDKPKKIQVRRSKLRDTILKTLSEFDKPITVEDLMKDLKHRHLYPNKTSVYRSLETLMKLEMILEVDFLDGKKRYEPSDQTQKTHHHHIICTVCESVKCIEVEKQLHKIEAKIAQETGYLPQKHALEFFGLCPNCQASTQV